MTERAVQFVKGMLKKCKIDGSDTRLAMLVQRNTPRDDQLEPPAQRLMSRNTRTSLDNHSEILMLATISDVPRKLEALRKRQKFYADQQTQSSRGFCKRRQGASGRAERRIVLCNCEGVCR
jgi:hypothetical protein